MNFITELRSTLMDKENQLSKTRQELEELQEYKVRFNLIEFTSK